MIKNQYIQNQVKLENKDESIIEVQLFEKKNQFCYMQELY